MQYFVCNYDYNKKNNHKNEYNNINSNKTLNQKRNIISDLKIYFTTIVKEIKSNRRKHSVNFIISVQTVPIIWLFTTSFLKKEFLL